MEYKNDKCEFTAFVKAGLDSKEQENIEICIERVTKTVKEDFLNARARLYKDEVKNDAEANIVILILRTPEKMLMMSH